MKMILMDHVVYYYQRLAEHQLRMQYDGRFVAMFHQVDDDADKWYDNQYSISFLGFQQFVDQLQKDGYEIVSPWEILKKEEKKKVVLSFDDVFAGVYFYVFPFLRQRNIPFVIFPAIDKLQENGFLNKEMLLEMAEYQNCYIGAHGISHGNLRQMSKEMCRKEIVESGNQLERIIKKPVELFAYPYGSLNAVGRRERLIAGQRYRTAFGTLQAGVTVRADHIYVPRINVNEKNYNHVLA